MKAEDTVIKDECGFHSGHCLELDRQAKISFKAGIKEVVEWIHTHNIETEGVDGLEDAWDVKLKEWGLE